MSAKLNDRYIARLPFADKGTRYEVPDKKQPGLVVRISTQTKSFYWRTRVNYRPVKIHLGVCGHTSIHMARAEVLKLILQSREGVLPPSLRKEKALRHPSPTLQEIFDSYVAMRKLRDTSKETYGKLMRLYLSGLSSRKVSEITPEDCFQLYQSLRDGKSPAKANGVIQLLDALMKYAGAVHEVEVCQVKAKIKAAGLLTATPARDSMIKDTQLKAWFDSLKPRPLHYRVMLLTTVLTGFRKAEIEKLQWNDVDLLAGTLLARETKNHRDHLLPLGPQLINMLKHYREVTREDHIFGNRVDRWAAIASEKGGIKFSRVRQLIA